MMPHRSFGVFPLSIVLQAVLINLLGYSKVVGASTGVLEVDLIFPRNETYAPQERFPVVFAIRNIELAQFVAPVITFKIRDLDDLDSPPIGGDTHEVRYLDATSKELVLAHSPFGFSLKKESRWLLAWDVGTRNCTDTGMGETSLKYNWTSIPMRFATQNGGQEVNLATPTTATTCDESQGVTVNVTEIMEMPNHVDPIGVDWIYGESCASLASNAPPPSACQVTIESSAAASISSAIEKRWCQRTNAPFNCGESRNKKNAADRFGARGFIAVLITLGSVLAQWSF
ncbi:hypothetical protein BU24DRAFT_428936 [Aaosphaeria arxii CBS 175.79]|uniref:DUF7136 domain-containing protein n=1 Tax=Aaosphaeria arxii CBS 175.79 TaxID=1450172 RepID=A0A6A5X885_9PLEO|nr:uncharacterized protein BU24DRAFT_428936 [Aaosphaeria arxii CBS 175.79]KAF2008964.1 hypothetical protein BU24DRAFT_428936 [Aaosphaeria arxii CBS 175.79]